MGSEGLQKLNPTLNIQKGGLGIGKTVSATLEGSPARGHGPVLEPKMAPKSAENRSKIEHQTDCKTDLIFESIFGQFLIDFLTIFGRILIQIRSTLDQDSKRFMQTWILKKHQKPYGF